MSESSERERLVEAFLKLSSRLPLHIQDAGRIADFILEREKGLRQTIGNMEIDENNYLKEIAELKEKLERSEEIIEQMKSSGIVIEDDFGG